MRAWIPDLRFAPSGMTRWGPGTGSDVDILSNRYCYRDRYRYRNAQAIESDTDTDTDDPGFDGLSLSFQVEQITRV